MKKIFLLSLVLIGSISFNATLTAQNWLPAGDKIKTQWAEKVDPLNPLPEYPRPAMVREQWSNLNGLWNYAILPKGSAIPTTFDGKILVPFAVESSLSGVQKPVGEENELWYSRQFTIPTTWANKIVRLNFGAVDWKADVWINDIQIGSHTGGYTPFSFDITPFLVAGKAQKITVRVWDPADKSFQPRGKQVSRPGGIWYTSVTGIWQTVWMEAVGENYLTHLKFIPNIDRNTVSFTSQASENRNTDIVEVKILESGKVISQGKGISGQEILLAVPDAKLWSPESPFL
jgi:beta-galactosidase/beta-glucuronidase